MAELAPDEEHFHATSPTTVIHGIFSDTATRLSGTYVDLSRRAATVAERERWWEKVLELEPFRRSVDPDDREALVSHIKQWRSENNRYLSPGSDQYRWALDPAHDLAHG